MFMTKLKLAELVILAISALITAAKSIIKFIDYIGRMRKPIAGKA
jgi:hypothetical protein